MYSVPAETAALPGRKINSLEDLLHYAEGALDGPGLARIIARWPPRPHEQKYLDTRRWLEKLWYAAAGLGLQNSRPLRILDLGTGAGHFPFVCRALGHEVVALDRGDSPFFKAMAGWVGFEPVDHMIRPFRKLPDFGGRFDLVTAFRIGFNVKPDRTTYDLPEWTFFLDHIEDDILRPGGALCLKFNVSPNRTGRKADDPELRALFAAHGARDMPGRFVTFDPLRRGTERPEVAAA